MDYNQRVEEGKRTLPGGLDLKTLRIVLIILLLFSLQSPVEGGALVSRIHFKAVGDIMVHDVQYNSAYNYQTGQYDFSPMFQPVREALQADLLVGNLETTLSGPELGFSSYPRFNSPDNIAETLSNLKFDLLFTANNHCLDKGVSGLRRTIDVLDKNNILHTGTFKKPEDREEILIIMVKGMSFGFLNYTYGTNGLLPPQGEEYVVNLLQLNQIEEDIAKIRNKVDLVVVGLHFGVEYQREPNLQQREIVKSIADSGADIILGGHPHVLQPYEFIKVGDREAFVAYSLGNFVSGQKGRYKDSGAILDLVIEKSLFDKRPRIVEVDFTPVWVRRYFAESRLKMEVVPYENSTNTQFNNQDLRAIAQVNSDVQEVWSPLKRSNFLLELIKLSTSVYLPGVNVNPWLPFY